MKTQKNVNSNLRIPLCPWFLRPSPPTVYAMSLTASLLPPGVLASYTVELRMQRPLSSPRGTLRGLAFVHATCGLPVLEPTTKSDGAQRQEKSTFSCSVPTTLASFESRWRAMLSRLSLGRRCVTVWLTGQEAV